MDEFRSVVEFVVRIQQPSEMGTSGAFHFGDFLRRSLSAFGPGDWVTFLASIISSSRTAGQPHRQPTLKTVLESLPTVIIDSARVGSEAKCSVCLEFFFLDNSAVSLPCEHIFHAECVIPWLQRQST